TFPTIRILRTPSYPHSLLMRRAPPAQSAMAAPDVDSFRTVRAAKLATPHTTSPPPATWASATRSSAEAVRAAFSWRSSSPSNLDIEFLPELLPRREELFIAGCFHLPRSSKIGVNF